MPSLRPVRAKPRGVPLGRRTGEARGLGFAAGVIILAGVVLRFLNLGGRSFWFDEAYGIVRALAPDLKAVLTSPPSIEPPLYYVFLHFWIHPGVSEAWARSLSAVFSSCGLAAAWFLAARLMPGGRALALLALLALFALSPFQIIYAQEARPYALTIALALGSAWALLAAVEKDSKRHWAAWAVMAALAGLSHLAALSWVVCGAVFALLTRPRAAVVRRLALFAPLAAAPAVAFWIFALPGISHVTGLAGPVASLYAFATGTAQRFWAGPFVPGVLYLPAMVIFAGLGTLGAWAALSPGWRRGGMTREAAAFLAFALLPLLLLYAACLAGFLHLPKPRYAAASQFFWLAAVVQGVWFFRGLALRRLVTAALLLICAVSLPAYFAGREPALDLPPYKKPLRDAAALISSRARSGDRVVSVNLLTFLPLRLYLGNSMSQAYLKRDDFFMDAELEMLGRPSPVERILERRGRVWLVLSPVYRSDPPLAPPEVARAFEARAAVVETYLLPGIRVELWEVKGTEEAGGR